MYYCTNCVTSSLLIVLMYVIVLCIKNPYLTFIFKRKKLLIYDLLCHLNILENASKAAIYLSFKRNCLQALQARRICTAYWCLIWLDLCSGALHILSWGEVTKLHTYWSDYWLWLWLYLKAANMLHICQSAPTLESLVVESVSQ